MIKHVILQIPQGLFFNSLLHVLGVLGKHVFTVHPGT